ncbi:hypothetical protein E2320_003400 [Naja naja]|nr:hypothetical protein E2320_003400 [Naja naja]
MKSRLGRHKAFSTCVSHLLVVSFFGGPSICMYLLPKTDSAPDCEKQMAVFYIVITPLLNSIIYTLQEAMTEAKNFTYVKEFILLGLTSHRKTQLLLFGIILIIYFLTILGNILIIILVKVNSNLHTPMYYFLSHLAGVDMCYVTTTMPLMLTQLLTGDGAISFAFCMVQIYIAVTLGGVEILLFGVMASRPLPGHLLSFNLPCSHGQVLPVAVQFSMLDNTFSGLFDLRCLPSLPKLLWPQSDQ